MSDKRQEPCDLLHSRLRYLVAYNELEFLEMKLSRIPLITTLHVQFSEAKMRLINESLFLNLQENLFISAIITVSIEHHGVIHLSDKNLQNYRS